MKLSSILAASAVALGLSLPFGANAADAGDAGASAAAPAMAPHSHAQEKLGDAPHASPDAGAAGAKKRNPATDRTRHFHPRDK